MLGKGKYFYSHSTSSDPSSIKDNRWWKLISLFPGPTQETLIYFLLHAGNTEGESLFRMNPYKVTSLLHQCEDMALYQTLIHCRLQALYDHHRSQLLAQVVQCFGADEHFFCLTHLFYFFLWDWVHLSAPYTHILGHLPSCNPVGDVCARSMALLISCKILCKVCCEHCASAMFWEWSELLGLHWKSKSAGNSLEVKRRQLTEMRTQGTLCLASKASEPCQCIWKGPQEQMYIPSRKTRSAFTSH